MRALLTVSAFLIGLTAEQYWHGNEGWAWILIGVLAIQSLYQYLNHDNIKKIKTLEGQVERLNKRINNPKRDANN